jgi:hypothetical protein
VNVAPSDLSEFPITTVQDFQFNLYNTTTADVSYLGLWMNVSGLWQQINSTAAKNGTNTLSYTLGAEGAHIWTGWANLTNGTSMWSSSGNWTITVLTTTTTTTTTTTSTTTTTTTTLSGLTPEYKEFINSRPLQGVRDVFANLMGGFFYAFLLGILFIGVWIRVRSLILPTLILDIVLAAYFWTLMPAQVQNIIYALNFIMVGMIIYRLVTPVYGE